MVPTPELVLSFSYAGLATGGLFNWEYVDFRARLGLNQILADRVPGG
jgi:hypothetical protein